MKKEIIPDLDIDVDTQIIEKYEKRLIELAGTSQPRCSLCGRFLPPLEIEDQADNIIEDVYIDTELHFFYFQRINCDVHDLVHEDCDIAAHSNDPNY